MAKIKRLIKYNWQVDNFGFDRLRSTAQCGYTSAAMVLSARIPDASNDWFVKEFIMEMDKDFIIGKSKTRRGAAQGNYKAVMDKYLHKYDLPFQTKVVPQGGTQDTIIKALESGSPLMASTMLTTSGHYICIIGIDTERSVLICHDSFGKFDFKTKKYTVNAKAGESVEYNYADIFPVMEASSRAVFGKNATGFRILWVE
jgi:hypothetical protein